MPALVFLNRRWHIASDDLAIPGCCILAALSCMVIIIAVALGELHNPLGCIEAQRHSAYFIALLCCWCASMLTQFAVVVTSLRGTMLDVIKRQAIVPLLYCAITSTTLTIGVNCYGTWLIYGDADETAACVVTDGGWSNHTVTMAVVWTNWAFLACWFVGLLLAYNFFPDYDEAASWDARCRCLNAVFCCWNETSVKHRAPHRPRPSSLTGAAAVDIESGAGSPEELAAAETLRREDQSPLARLAAICSLFFGNDDLTVSDVMAALLLVGISQRLERHLGRAVLDHEQMRVEQEAMEQGAYDAEGQQYAEGGTPGGTQGRSGGGGSQDDSGVPLAVQLEGAQSRSGRGTLMGNGATLGQLNGGVQQNGGGGQAQQADVAEGDSGGALLQAASGTRGSGRTAGAPGGSGDDGAEAVPMRVLEDAEHYFQFALGCYGWLMYVWAHKGRGHRWCSLCLSCCSCCCRRSAQMPELMSADSIAVSKRFNIEAFHQFTHLPPEDLLYASHQNNIASVPYFIAAVPQRQEIIIAIRGSFSVEDCVTDLLCEPTVLPASWLAGSPELFTADAGVTTPPDAISSGGGGGNAGGLGVGNASVLHVHDGIFRCAEAVLVDLLRHRVLAAVFNNDPSLMHHHPHHLPQRDCSGWKLVVTGHSLGAGVASLLAVHLKKSAEAALAQQQQQRRQQQRSQGLPEDVGSASLKPIGVHCWAFAPPGGTMCRPLSLWMRGMCTSVVTGRDMMSRLSVKNVKSLMRDMMEAASRVRVSKTKLWLRSVLLDKNWTEDKLFMPNAEVPPQVHAIVAKYREQQETAAAKALAVQLRPANSFVVPGRVVYLEAVKVPSTPDTPRRERTPVLQSFPSHRRNEDVIYKPRWMSVEELATGGVLVTRHMFSSHIPTFQQLVLAQVVQNAKLMQNAC